MPKFDSKEEYLKWKKEKLQQGKDEPVSEKEQPPVANSVNNSRRSSVKAFYIFPLILLALAILYFIANSFDYGRNPSLSQSTNHKQDKFDEIPSKPKHESSALTTAEKEEPEITKPEQNSSALTTVEKPEPETSPAKLTIPKMVKQARKAVVTIKTSKSLGSGFLISPSGKIVTNTHVVGKDQTVEVVFASGVSERASVVMKGTIPLDIAILEINSSRSDYDYLELDDSSDCAEGVEVIAIGSPRGLTDTVTKGVISNCNRIIDDSGVYYLQTDTPINPGNSGGPLINSHGEVMGVNTLSRRDSEGLNLSIAINMVKDFTAWKLTFLEEKFRSEREEKVRKLVKYFGENWERELSEYRFKVYRRLYPRETQSRDFMSRINFSQELKAEGIVSTKKTPPSGFNSLEKWFEAMAEDVIDEKVTVEKVVEIIKHHFSYD